MCVCMKTETLIVTEGERRVVGPGGDVPGPRAVSGRRGEKRERFDCRFAFRAHAMGVLHRRFLQRQFEVVQAWAVYKAHGRLQEDLTRYRGALRQLLKAQGVELKLIGGAL